MASRMHEHDAEMTRLVSKYFLERLAMDPVPLDQPGDTTTISQALSGLISAEGRGTQVALDVYADTIAKTVLSADHHRFWAFIPSAPTKASLLFDMVVSCASIQGISWLEAAGAVAAENQVLRWLADAAGLPASAGGTFVSGGSAANLSALVVARDTAKRLHPDGARLRIAVSDQAHSSVRNTANIIGVDLFVVSTPDHVLTGDALRAAVAADPEAAADVFAVVATCGTTNAGIIDDLTGVGQVAGHLGWWFHVDGAYGGAGLLAPSVREKYAGIELADSFIVDPHKWLFAPFDCAALLYRQPELARAVHTQDASYLDAIHGPVEEWNPTDYAYHLTRRARGLPLWFSLVVHGTNAYRDAIESSLTLARDVAALITATPGLTLLREPTLSVVLWQRDGWEAGDYRAWSDRLLHEQIAFVTPTTWQGQMVGRFAFLHPRTTLADVETVLATLR